MIRTVTILGLGLFLGASCASSSTFKKDSSSGYCFKAEGLRTARCHTEMTSCLRSESTLRDVYPFATIESSCHQRSHGILEVQQVAESSPDHLGQ